MNWAKTFLLMAVMSALFLFIGYAFAGERGMFFALIFAAIMNFGSYWFSDKIVLMMYGAKPISEQESPQLYGIVEKLTREAGLPMPKLYLMDNPTPNAFATGRDPNHAAVAVTSGIMGILDSSEIEGVLAHELSHVKNRDILIGTIAATFAAAIMMLARMALWFGGGRDRDREGGGLALIALMILGYIGALLIQMWISRTREYEADASGARITHNPMGLANALMKLERGVEARPMDAEPATAHMFIVSPFSGKQAMGLLARAFSTHPPIPERVARLKAMADDQQYPRMVR